MSEDAVEGSFVVVRNQEGHYSIWSAELRLPAGWSRVGDEGSREDCLEFIETAWDDPILGAGPTGPR